MTVSLVREAAVSFVINALLSLAFFLAMFWSKGAQLSFGAPDGLGIDFLPQSVAVALMSALVPALVLRGRWVRMGIGHAPLLRSVVLRALAFAVGGALLGVLLALLCRGGPVSFLGWQAALWIKLVYGGLLGAMITTMTLRRMVR